MRDMRTICVILGVIISSLSLVSSRRGVSVPNFSIRPPMLDRGRIHYKTTYACEGNSLVLNCEEGRTIHLVRANYGRFSISICNDGGRLDLSVNCMSYRSFLITQDRCSQKSNCSVIVSSKMFGDPCPGTLKYLEVQYHCVHGASSSATTTRRPPIQFNIPILPESSNNSLLFPSVQPTTISSNEDVMPIITTEAHNNRRHESNISPSTPLTTPNSFETHQNRKESIESKEVDLPYFSFDFPESKPIIPTLSPLTSYKTPTEDNTPSPPKLPPPPPPPPFASHFPPLDLKSDYCPPIFVRSLFWNWTRKGEIAVQKCPGGATGSVRWECSAHTMYGLVDWVPERPDFRECRSLWLDNLEERLNNGDPVIRIANELALMTLTKALFCEDLQRIAYIIQETLARAVVSMEHLQSVEVWHRHQVLKELLMFVVEAVSNLLDNAQDDAWLDLSAAERKRVASKLLEGLELSALLLADNTNQDGSFTVAKPNVLVSVHVLDTRMPISLQFPTVEDTRGTMEWIRMEDSLFLPAQALLDYTTNGLAKVAFLAYYRIEDLLKPDSLTMHSSADDSSALNMMANKLQNITSGSSLSINSRVIGASLSINRNGEIPSIALSHPITIILRHIQEENASSPKCVYWNAEKRDWLMDGCWMQSTNATHTVCMCNHLTHFALLMDIRSLDMLTHETNWQKMIVIIGCATALLCLVFITVVVCVVSAGNTEAVTVHRNLCVTLLITELTYLIGIYRTDIGLFCSLTAAFLHYFLLASFLWTFLESFDLYYNLVDVYESVKSTKRLMWYYLIAYGGPTFIIFISALIDPSSYGTTSYCWLRIDNYFCFSFVGPAIGIMFGAIVFVVIACFILYSNSDTNTTIKCIEEAKLDITKSGVKWVALLLCIQCLTWTFGLFHVNVQSSSAIAILFAIFNVILAVYVTLFCVMKTDNIQHHRLLRSLPFMSFCFNDVNCANAKNSMSDPFSVTNRPVVTQVSATQVANVSVAHHHLQQQQQMNITTSPVSIGCPSPTQLSSLRLQPWNSPQEIDSCSTPLDRPYISALREAEDVLLNCKGGTTGPILVNPINSIPTVNVAIGDICAAALGSNNLADYECKIQQIKTNSLSRQPKSRRKIRIYGNYLEENVRHGPQTHFHSHPHNQYADHIYESIDSDSLSSGVYDRHNRFARRSSNTLSQINDFYGGNGAANNATNIADDEWSQNSSSSYGPLYEDRPLLIGPQPFNSSKHLTSQEYRHCLPHIYHSNLSIYNKSRDELSLYTQRNALRGRNIDRTLRDTPNQKCFITSNSQNTHWNIYPESSGTNADLPDLIQNPSDASNGTIAAYMARNRDVSIDSQVMQHHVSNIAQHSDENTYC